MNEKCYIFLTIFSRAVYAVLPAKVVTFTHDININKDSVNHQLFTLGMMGDRNIEAGHL